MDFGVGMKTNRFFVLAAALGGLFSMVPADAAPLCGLEGYKALPGLTATNEGSGLTVTWDGDRNEQIRLRLTLDNGTPTIRDLAVRQKGAGWATLAANVIPEFRVVSGLRRVEQE